MIQTSSIPDTACPQPRQPAQWKEWIFSRYGFRTFQPEDGPLVDRYSQTSVFFDLSFTNFWAWDKVFHYTYRLIDDALAVVYITLDQVPAAIVMPGPSRRIDGAVDLLTELFGALGQPLQIEYVPEEWLPLYHQLNRPMELFSDRDWSDYVYNVSDFLNLEGGENRGKRRELKQFADRGAVEFRPLNEETFDEALMVFQRWCDWHNCTDCYYGCEQRAFARLRKLWNRREYYGGIVHLDGEPVAFALGETLGNCACYSFQKNVENFRGLTYYLSYHCAQLPGHPPKLNWCEDMGLEGLRVNKLRYRPSELVSKYTVILET